MLLHDNRCVIAAPPKPQVLHRSRSRTTFQPAVQHSPRPGLLPRQPRAAGKRCSQAAGRRGGWGMWPGRVLAACLPPPPAWLAPQGMHLQMARAPAPAAAALPCAPCPLCLTCLLRCRLRCSAGCQPRFGSPGCEDTQLQRRRLRRRADSKGSPCHPAHCPRLKARWVAPAGCQHWVSAPHLAAPAACAGGGTRTQPALRRLHGREQCSKLRTTRHAQLHSSQAQRRAPAPQLPATATAAPAAAPAITPTLLLLLLVVTATCTHAPLLAL